MLFIFFFTLNILQSPGDVFKIWFEINTETEVSTYPLTFCCLGVFVLCVDLAAALVLFTFSIHLIKFTAIIQIPPPLRKMFISFVFHLFQDVWGK